MSSPHPTSSFDATPLTAPVDPVAVAAFAAELKAGRTSSGASAGTVVGAIIAAFALVFACLVGVFVVGGLVRSFSSSGDGSGVAFVIGILVIAVAGGLTIGLFVRRANRIRRYRLGMFARANGMEYVDRIASPGLPGMIFSLGSGRVATDLVRGTRPRFVEFGNYQYTVKHGKSSTTYRWGYVAVKLDVPLPNIVLDALGNNGFGSNLPTSFQRAQRLSLEGDFDQHFTLYCPEGYEQDALYLFTPDIMARFIDHAAELDVEIVDDWMFLYTKREASTLDPATWAWLFGVVGALITKLDQWARWRDERLSLRSAARAAAPGSSVPTALPFAPPVGLLTPPAGVAPQGRRLKKRTTWIPLVVMVGAIVAWTIIRSL
ncbi:hypothetical protein [uncultured Microbacterium sp.]|uniref:hypothetical protein n=1 Tax=uncultured Microbacterium sp. TaxID=191216 RepID=UPI0028DBF54A|nr:hypothetical protein [uncultured Microbacterium sp.]